ncbi:Hypothetical_protein [Hexamita inflata]|uniref:Hypothetical_protein n=1 Tax=Hexamita inflata TaxID=28002 RepID=A0AA86QHU6_9EUKA|nr:Hypothetical protein HINF_LOCUS39595 [Hexamita inflata]CAI9951955.1 Hypothetical protein HINF_LOCUS39600 [Hexamita inflata]
MKRTELFQLQRVPFLKEQSLFVLYQFQSQPKDDQNSKYTMADDQNDYKLYHQSTVDYRADVEWKYCFYQKQWSEEYGVIIYVLVVYKSVVYMQLQNYKQLIVFQSLTYSKLTIQMTKTRSDRKRWLALISLQMNKLI